jgi:hypothetical protein
VVVFDTLDRFVQSAVQGRVIAEILANRVVDPIELALDDAFFRLSPGGEKNVPITCREVFL